MRQTLTPKQHVVSQNDKYKINFGEQMFPHYLSFALFGESYCICNFIVNLVFTYTQCVCVVIY